MNQGSRPLIVVMGVSGAGKSTVGRAVADRLGIEYADGGGISCSALRRACRDHLASMAPDEHGTAVEASRSPVEITQVVVELLSDSASR